LEHNDKEKGAACHNWGEHGEVEDPCMNALDTDPEEKKSNWKFAEDHRQAVEEVTEPPAMFGDLYLLSWKVAMVSSCTIMYPGSGGGHVEDKEELELSESDHTVEYPVHTNARPISQSSSPNAFTIFTRT
jgi:hypothetical protein